MGKMSIEAIVAEKKLFQGPVVPDATQGIMASSRLFATYGKGSKFDVGASQDVKPTLSVLDAEKDLLDLAARINRGKVTSHGEVARVILKLGDNLSPFSGATLGINDAAINVRNAILQQQERFSDRVSFTGASFKMR